MGVSVLNRTPPLAYTSPILLKWVNDRINTVHLFNVSVSEHSHISLKECLQPSGASKWAQELQVASLGDAHPFLFMYRYTLDPGKEVLKNHLRL
jgi:hypothetical protein